MVTVTCIEKFKDDSGKIVGYKLKDFNGVTQDISSKSLKVAIRENKIHVVNLKLTSDNRLIEHKEQSLSQLNINEDIKKIRLEEVAESIAFMENIFSRTRGNNILNEYAISVGSLINEANSFISKPIVYDTLKAVDDRSYAKEKAAEAYKILLKNKKDAIEQYIDLGYYCKHYTTILDLADRYLIERLQRIAVVFKTFIQIKINTIDDGASMLYDAERFEKLVNTLDKDLISAARTICNSYSKYLDFRLVNSDYATYIKGYIPSSAEKILNEYHNSNVMRAHDRYGREVGEFVYIASLPLITKTDIKDRLAILLGFYRDTNDNKIKAQIWKVKGYTNDSVMSIVLINNANIDWSAKQVASEINRCAKLVIESLSY